MFHRPCNKIKQKYLVRLTFYVECNQRTEHYFNMFLPVDSNDRSKEPRTSRDHICEDELKSCVVGLCQDVQRFSLASQFLENMIHLINRQVYHIHITQCQKNCAVIGFVLM